MKMVFDAGKDQSNRAKHGLSLERVIDFAIQIVFEDDRRDYGEQRWVAYGDLDGRLHCLVFTTPDETTLRPISFRKANTREVKRYG